MRFKKFHGGIDTVDYNDLYNYDYNYDDRDDYNDEYRKIGSIRRFFKGVDRDYYKPIRSDGGFGGRRNNFIEYKGRGDRYENLSPEEYLNIIRPYLRDLINDHKPTTESNDEANDSNAEREERKVQLVMQNNCISIKNFEHTRTIYSASELAEIILGSDTEDVIDRLFDTTLERFQEVIVTSQKTGSEFTRESVGLLYYYFMKIRIRRAESYVKSLDSKQKSNNKSEIWKR